MVATNTVERTTKYSVELKVSDKKIVTETIRLLLPDTIYEILKYKFNGLHLKLRNVLNLSTNQDLIRQIRKIVNSIIIFETSKNDEIYLDTVVDKGSYEHHVVVALLCEIGTWLEERGFVRIIRSKYKSIELDEFDANILITLFKKVYDRNNEN